MEHILPQGQKPPKTLNSDHFGCFVRSKLGVRRVGTRSAQPTLGATRWTGLSGRAETPPDHPFEKAQWDAFISGIEGRLVRILTERGAGLKMRGRDSARADRR